MATPNMNIIIQTGFESIVHKISFQPQTISKGKSLVTAGHVRDVKEFRKCSKSNLIKSKVVRQTSVTLAPYDTTLHINDERLIEKVSCTCVYNQSGKCKHVAALIYFINNEESLTKTSYEQEWGKPSARQFVKEKYSKGQNFDVMYPPKKTVEKFEIQKPSIGLEELDNSPLKQILVADKESDDFYVIKNLLSSLVISVDQNLQKEDCEEILNNFFIFKDQYVIYSKEYPLEKQLQNFYNENIMINNEDVVKLCCLTINQSQCPQWHQVRRFRLSASTNIHNIKIRTRKSIDKLVNDILNPNNIDCESTNYGLTHEKCAKKKYEELYGCEVKKVGVIVSEKQPWLCASVDGVVIYDGCIVKLVEFKCPIKCKKQPVVDRKNRTCNVKYFYFENDEVRLKMNDPYFTQIQVQMYITGMFTCDLFIYSPVPNGCYTLTIDRNENFLKEIILCAENFYFQHFLPATYLEITKNTNMSTNDHVQSQKIRTFTGVNVMNNVIN